MKKLHKWTGLFLLFLFIWMAVSGIVLNHRKAFAGIDISREKLPSEYLYDNWNYGFFKGSLSVSPDSVFLYGSEGVWLSDTQNSYIHELNTGLPEGADNRKVCRVVQEESGIIYCATFFGLYYWDKDTWIPIALPASIDRISDLETHEGITVVLTRSEYLVGNKKNGFIRQQFQASPDLDTKRPLFRIIWTLHSGELFGTFGKIIVDGLAICFILLSITGLSMYLLPKLIRYRKKRNQSSQPYTGGLRFSWKWHNKLGYWLFIPLLLVVITGACLRPPLLILLSKTKVSPPPFTTLKSKNPWQEVLRSIRYDTIQEEWLLYTSEGFFVLPELKDIPRKLRHQPRVSVMGLNAFQQLDESFWIVGSFNGFIIWNRYTGEMFDGFTGETYINRGGMPFGEQKVSGYSADFENRIVVFLYDTGAYVFSENESFSAMPVTCAGRPMSWWNLALEMHTGRLFTFLGIWSILYPFLFGILSICMLVSGWQVYRKRKYKRR